MRPGESTVLLIPEEVWTTVPRTVATLRDRTVVEFDHDRVTCIDRESPKGTLTLAKDGDKWRLTAPEGLPADQVEAGAILFKLRELKAQAFLTDDASGVPRFLGKPEVRVSVTEEGAKEAKTVLLAPSPERRGGQPRAYAGVAGRGPVVLVEGKALGELAKSVTDLRDRALLGGLDPKEIKRLRIKSGAQAALLERTGDAEWKVLEPKKGPAKSARVEDLLYALRALRWKDIAEPGGKEPAKYGLDAPAFEVSLHRADGTEIATVQTGKREAERQYLRMKAAPAIYAIDPKQLGDLPKIPGDLQG